MISLEAIQHQLAGHTLARSIEQLPKGHVRIETAFLYPDGSAVDVFVVEQDPLLPATKLSDLAQTTSWLADVQVKPWLSRKRQQMLHDALRIYGVRQEGGALERSMSSLADLVDGVVLLGQACVRVADLAYTRRSSVQSTFAEQVEEVIADTGVEYTPDAELQGRFGNVVKVDFLARGKSRSSAILTLASGNSSQASARATEIFKRWYDLETPASIDQRVTVFDDRVDVYRDEDLQRLGQYSDLVALSDAQKLRDLVAA